MSASALLSCAVAAAAFLFSAVPASATDVESPTIDGTSVTNVTEDGVTLVAQINPHGSETEYEFRLVWQDADPPASGEPIPGGPQVHPGRIAAGSVDQTVNANMTGLQAGYTYWYVVVAKNAEQTAKAGPDYFGFRNSGEYPEGVGTGPPYESEVPEWSIDLSEELSAQTLREYKAKQTHAAKEREEQQAQQAARYAAEAAALRHQEEELAAAKADPAGPVCIVPSLKGDSLGKAERLLSKAHCRLGKVTQTKRHYHGQLVVTRQRVSSGRKLPRHARVGITLGQPPRRRFS